MSSSLLKLTRTLSVNIQLMYAFTFAAFNNQHQVDFSRENTGDTQEFLGFWGFFDNSKMTGNEGREREREMEEELEMLRLMVCT